MATSFLQKLRLAWRGWSRRRDDEAKRKQEEFLRKNTGWGAAAPAAAPPPVARAVPATAIDREGIQAAFLESSGKIAHFFDLETGDVVEFGSTESRPEITGNAARYKRIPTRTSSSEDDDRRAFVEALEDAGARARLASVANDATEFRRAISADRAVEKAWYNFKNDRAIAAIEAWLRTL